MFNSPLKQLRKSLWLTEVPDNISVPAIGDEPASVIPTEKATVDEIAFAELALSREISALMNRLHEDGIASFVGPAANVPQSHT